MRIVVSLLLLMAAPAVRAQSPPTFPAQQRPPGDPVLVSRGAEIYGIHCRACHGADLRGGDMGGPNLLRSQLVLNDQEGEAIGPVVTAGRVPEGGGRPMPPLPLPEADLKAVSLYIHSIVRTSQPQGAPPAGAPKPLNLLVGNARAGQRYFAANCTSCHAADGDLADGGPGVDTLALQGNYPGPATGPITGIEVLLLLSGLDERFGDLGGNLYDYALKSHDNWVVPGQVR